MVSTPESENNRRKSTIQIPFHYPDFGKLLSAQIISNIGSQFTYMALLFLIFDLTGNILAMSALSIAEVLPMVLIGPWAGIIIDRIDRKHSMVIASLTQSVIVATIPLTTLLPARELWILPLAFLNASAARFFFPARGASIPKLVNSEDLFAANSLSAATFQLSTLIGPVLAGVTLGFLDYNIAFWIDAVSFIIAAFIILTISTNLKVSEEQKDDSNGGRAVKKNNPLDDLKTSLNFAVKFPPILYMISFFSLLMFFGGSVLTLMIPFLELEMGLTDKGFREVYYGIVTAISASAGLVSAVIISRREELKKPLTIMTSTLPLVSVILLSFFFITDLVSLAIVWTCFGTIQVFVGIPIQTLAQETVPDHLRGKILSFLFLSVSIAQITGMGVVGIEASLFGIRETFLINGLSISVAAAICFVQIGKYSLEKAVAEQKEKMRELKRSNREISALPT
ncbi:MAG: MFS transporter [Candidatus Odinarchaeota archaeon]